MEFSNRAQYYEIYRKADRRIINKMLSVMKLSPNSVIADVGAGNGHYSAQLITDGHHLFSIDPSVEMISQCRDSRIKWIRAYAENLPLLNNSVDAAIFIFSLHHMKKIDSVLHEIHRVVGNGSVCVFTINPDFVDGFWLFDYFPDLRKYFIDNFVDFTKIKSLLHNEFHREPQEYVFMLPDDLVDMFALSLWKRPKVFLNPEARAAMSIFNYMLNVNLRDGLHLLENDLITGLWYKKYGNLSYISELDLGCRILCV